MGFYLVDLFCKIMKLILGRKLSLDSLNFCGFYIILVDIMRVLKFYYIFINKKIIIIYYIYFDKYLMIKLFNLYCYKDVKFGVF